MHTLQTIKTVIKILLVPSLHNSGARFLALVVVVKFCTLERKLNVMEKKSHGSATRLVPSSYGERFREVYLYRPFAFE